jgi:hypothetical protein
MLLTFSAPRVWPKSRRVAPPPTLCASQKCEGLPCRDRLQRKSVALVDRVGGAVGKRDRLFGSQVSNWGGRRYVVSAESVEPVAEHLACS